MTVADDQILAKFMISQLRNITQYAESLITDIIIINRSEQQLLIYHTVTRKTWVNNIKEVYGDLLLTKFSQIVAISALLVDSK